MQLGVGDEMLINDMCGLRRSKTVLELIEDEIRELRGDEMRMNVFTCAICRYETVDSEKICPHCSESRDDEKCPHDGEPINGRCP